MAGPLLADRIGVAVLAATQSLALVRAAAGEVVDEVVFPNTSPSHDCAR
jgi:hypothetical protein